MKKFYLINWTACEWLQELRTLKRQAILSLNSWMFIFFFEKQKRFLPRTDLSRTCPGGRSRVAGVLLVLEPIWSVDTEAGRSVHGTESLTTGFGKHQQWSHVYLEMEYSFERKQLVDWHEVQTKEEWAALFLLRMFIRKGKGLIPKAI